MLGDVDGYPTGLAMHLLRGLVGPLFIALLGVWLIARERPLLAAVAFVSAVAAASVIIIPVRRRRTTAAAILFTDIVESTRLMSLMGDSGWSEKLSLYETATRAAARDARAIVTKALGDGFLVVFDGPRASRTAIACATQIRELARSQDLETRAAVHVGDCLVSRGDATGLTVHIAARALAIASPGDVVVTKTARAALGDDDLPLEDAGVHELRGVPEPHRIYRLAN